MDKCPIPKFLINILLFCGIFRGKIYGLVAPGYEMAEAVASTMSGVEQPFTGADMSTKLKLMGVDVASFGRYSGFKVQHCCCIVLLLYRVY